MKKLSSRISLTGLALLLAGCSSMLPQSSSNTSSHFRSFEEAKLALEKVTPYKTTFEELKALGFDPQAATNVTVIPYPEVVTRLAPNSGVPLDALDRGVRECILAQTQCRAYVFYVAQQSRKREGGFWADFFNVRRTVAVTGWRFEGLVVLRNGLVLFRNVGGSPNTDYVEQQVNPLGPFQSGGESAGQLIMR